MGVGGGGVSECRAVLRHGSVGDGMGHPAEKGCLLCASTPLTLHSTRLPMWANNPCNFSLSIFQGMFPT